MAVNRSLLDPGQIIQDAYDEPNKSFRIEGNITVAPPTDPIAVAIDAADDNIRLGDGTLLNTLTQIGSEVGIDVNVIGGDISVTPSGLFTGLFTQSFIVTDIASPVPTTALANRNTISIRIMGNNIVYFGGSGVTPSNGYPKGQSEEITMDVKNNSSVLIYAVCDTGLTCEVRILEIA